MAPRSPPPSSTRPSSPPPYLRASSPSLERIPWWSPTPAESPPRHSTSRSEHRWGYSPPCCRPVEPASSTRSPSRGLAARRRVRSHDHSGAADGPRPDWFHARALGHSHHIDVHRRRGSAALPLLRDGHVTAGAHIYQLYTFGHANHAGQVHDPRHHHGQH